MRELRSETRFELKINSEQELRRAGINEATAETNG
jgi:hypothetical protein